MYGGSTAAPTPSASATLAPETAAYRDFGNRVYQAKWTAPATNQLLLEAGFGSYRSRWGGKEVPGLDTTNLIRVVEQCAAGCAANGNIPGLTYRSGNWSSNINWNSQWNAAMSLVTGSHSLKFGYQGALLYDDRKNFTNSEFLQYRFNNGVPDQMTLTINAFGVRQRVRSDAFYAQEQWTLGRMTLQGALRYDHAWSYFPEQTVGPVRFFPTAKTYPAHGGRRGLSRPVAARRRRLRPVRKRQDVAQGQRRPLPRGGAERRALHRAQPDRSALHDDHAGVDRLGPRLPWRTAIC